MIRTAQKIKMIKTSEIIPNPYQTRRKFDRREISSLAESIKEVGMLSPVIVRGSICGYELICGQRRLRAAIMAGIGEIPAIVVRAGDLQCAQLSLIENLQRVNLSLCEEAEGYYNLMSYHRVKKENLLKALSAESSRVNEKMRILSLGESVRYKIEENNISEKSARELLKLHDEDKQNEIADRIINEEINHREVCEAVKQTLRTMAQNKKEEKKQRRNRISPENMSLYINTVKKTIELLKNNGAKVELEQSENERYVEFTIKTFK